MTERHETTELEFFGPAERELIEKVRALPSNPGNRAFLERALLRLRNIVEKYSEQCKRDALKQASIGAGSAPESCRKLQICAAALDDCRKRLAAGSEKPSGSDARGQVY